MKLTPLKVTMLMHIHSIASPIPNAEFAAQMAALSEFETLGIITVDPDVRSCGYQLTEFGDAYIRLILSALLPEVHVIFIDSRTGEPV